MRRSMLVVVLCAGMVAVPAMAGRTSPATLTCAGESSDLPIVSLFVMPREEGQCHLQGPPGNTPYALHGHGVHATDDPYIWVWRAPKAPGLVTWWLRRADGAEEMRVQVWVMTPASRVNNGVLDTFRIGHYPGADPARGPLYRPPKGFVEVTAENADTPVSPHYRLGQFVSKQSSHYPKYVVLRTRLLEKLEWMTVAAIRDGLAQGPFVIMSGYRTPHYNQLLNNRPFSRHQWGGAADIFIDDNPRDGRMDDLNGDGQHDREDAEYLAAWLERQALSPGYQARFVGGLGIYGSNAAHGPFVHIDVRGQRARW